MKHRDPPPLEVDPGFPRTKTYWCPCRRCRGRRVWKREFWRLRKWQANEAEAWRRHSDVLRAL